MRPVLLKQVKKGEFFKFRPSETAKVYVRDDYDRESKKYEVYKFDDVNDYRFMKGTRIVWIDFIF